MLSRKAIIVPQGCKFTKTYCISKSTNDKGVFLFILVLD